MARWAGSRRGPVSDLCSAAESWLAGPECQALQRGGRGCRSPEGPAVPCTNTAKGTQGSASIWPGMNIHGPFGCPNADSGSGSDPSFKINVEEEQRMHQPRVHRLARESPPRAPRLESRQAAGDAVRLTVRRAGLPTSQTCRALCLASLCRGEAAAPGAPGPSAWLGEEGGVTSAAGGGVSQALLPPGTLRTGSCCHRRAQQVPAWPPPAETPSHRSRPWQSKRHTHLAACHLQGQSTPGWLSPPPPQPFSDPGLAMSLGGVAALSGLGGRPWVSLVMPPKQLASQRHPERGHCPERATQPCVCPAPL